MIISFQLRLYYIRFSLRCQAFRQSFELVIFTDPTPGAVKISTAFALGNGRGVSREKSRFQTGY